MEDINHKVKQVELQIKEEIPTFDSEELLEFTKIIIPNLYNFFNYEREEKLEKYCNNELIKKVLENKGKYRISKDIDIVRVGYARLDDFMNLDGKVYIKVYASVFFYDDAENNNSLDIYACDKYWNDIWTITYEINDNKEKINKCPNCGASMTYDKKRYMYTCDYCKNNMYYSQINWKLNDIEVNDIKYKI